MGGGGRGFPGPKSGTRGTRFFGWPGAKSEMGDVDSVAEVADAGEDHGYT